MKPIISLPNSLCSCTKCDKIHGHLWEDTGEIEHASGNLDRIKWRCRECEKIITWVDMGKI